MIFNKSEVGLDLAKPRDLAQSYVVTMAKCQSLYLMGGFLDQTASPLLNATYLRAWAALKRMDIADLSNLGTLVGHEMLQLGVPLSSFPGSHLFSLQQITKILFSPAEAKAYENFDTGKLSIYFRHLSSMPQTQEEEAHTEMMLTTFAELVVEGDTSKNYTDH